MQGREEYAAYPRQCMGGIWSGKSQKSDQGDYEGFHGTFDSRTSGSGDYSRNPENALGWNITSGTIPALRVLAEDETYSAPLLEALPWLENVLPLLQYGSYIGIMPDRDLVFYDIIYPYILDTLQGLMTVDEALELIDEDANSVFE